MARVLKMKFYRLLPIIQILKQIVKQQGIFFKGEIMHYSLKISIKGRSAFFSRYCIINLTDRFISIAGVISRNNKLF
jgi:hypothetical protein